MKISENKPVNCIWFFGVFHPNNLFIKSFILFRITEIKKKNIITYRLLDESSGTFADIVPQCGAILNHFSILLPEGAWNVIQGYEDISEFNQQVEANGFRSCKLSPFVNRLKNGTYSFGEKNFNLGKYWLGKHSIHGFLYDAVFDVITKSADQNGATLICHHRYNGHFAGFPFPYDIQIEYRLKKGNRLFVKTRIQNQDVGMIPIADGWHPYFRLGERVDDLWLEFQSKSMLELDAEWLPTGKLIPYEEYGSLKKIGAAQFDHCFTVNFHECQPMVVLRDPVQNLQLEIQPDPSYPYLQVYTPKDRKSIALENTSAAPDAFNNALGLQVLPPGESAEFQLSYCLRDLSQR